MIRWIRPDLGTASHDLTSAEPGLVVIDVRDLVDKAGNAALVIRDRIQAAQRALDRGLKVVVCCDYGISRSNAVAAGILTQREGLDFNDAVRQVMQATGEKAFKVEVLAAVREAVAAREHEAPQARGRGRNILLTGGSGFVGRALHSRLAAAHTVTVPTRDQVDLLAGPAELDLLAKESHAECIVHLANPRVYTSSTAMGETVVLLRNVLDVCRENHLRLLYLSTWEVYSGYCSAGLLASESVPPLPKGVYGETKYLCEALIRLHQEEWGLECTLIRAGPVYGPGGDRPKFIYNFLDKAVRGAEIVTHRYRNGFPHLDLMHRDDLVAALALVIERDVNGPLHLGTGICTSTTDVARLLCEHVGSQSRIVHREIDAYAPNIAMDASRARALLGWQPQISLATGLADMVAEQRNRVGSPGSSERGGRANHPT